MARRSVADETQASVLLRARRRCCICFGLNRDTSIKQGQLAHLDGDASNSGEDNVAFLCFDHHDRYDSATSQSKNYTIAEVCRYRTELHEAIGLAFASPVAFGDASVCPPDEFSGHYIRMGEVDESAELTVAPFPGHRYHVSGIALWGTSREQGPRIGDLDFVADMREGVLEYMSTSPSVRRYRAILTFTGGGLTVSEENWLGMFGLNVRFTGRVCTSHLTSAAS